jgi:hypothetical protein
MIRAPFSRLVTVILFGLIAGSYLYAQTDEEQVFITMEDWKAPRPILHAWHGIL